MPHRHRLRKVHQRQLAQISLGQRPDRTQFVQHLDANGLGRAALSNLDALRFQSCQRQSYHANHGNNLWKAIDPGQRAVFRSLHALQNGLDGADRCAKRPLVSQIIAVSA